MVSSPSPWTKTNLNILKTSSDTDIIMHFISLNIICIWTMNFSHEFLCNNHNCSFTTHTVRWPTQYTTFNLTFSHSFVNPHFSLFPSLPTFTSHKINRKKNIYMIREYPIVGVASSNEDFFYFFSLSMHSFFHNFFSYSSLSKFFLSSWVWKFIRKSVAFCSVLYFHVAFFDFAHRKRTHTFLSF